MTELRSRLIGELKLRGRSDRTINSYVSYIYRLARYYRVSPDKLDTEQIRGFLRHLADERRLSAGTLNVAINAVVFFYRDVLGRKMAGALAGIRRPRPRESLPKAYSKQQVYRILTDGCFGRPLWEVYLMAVYSAGLRLIESCSLRWCDLEFDRGMLRVNCGKGGKDRYVPLSPTLAGRLRGFRKQADAQGLVFASRRLKGRAISTGTGQRIYNQAVEQCGVARKGGIHCLRHSYATHQLERGVDINTLRVLMGHKNVQTTMIYLRVARRRVAAAGTPLEDLYPQFGQGGQKS